MDIGFTLPHLDKQSHNVAKTALFAREVEKAGAVSLWVGDRTLTAVHPKMNAGGRDTEPAAEHRAPVDPLITLAFAAGATERALLGMHVLIAPLYPPVQLARSLTTLDLASNGRVVAGFGVGRYPQEFEAAGLDFHRRGARMDELLDALAVLWTRDPAEYHGKEIDIPLHHSPLKPVQRPGIPVYIGARAEVGLQRVGRRADGWLPMCIVPHAMDVTDIRVRRLIIDNAARAAGRDPGAIDTVMRVNIDAGISLQRAADAVKMLAERTGIDHFLIETSFQTTTAEESLEMATRILPLIQRG
jgi:probable F420-dependent oxidoreductase